MPRISPLNDPHGTYADYEHELTDTQEEEESMSTIREWFGNTPPDLIQFPKVEEATYGLEAWYGVPTKCYTWNSPEIQQWLDLKFDSGFGSQGVPSFHAWTSKLVYYVWEYDGSTSLAYVPRHPPT